MRGLFRLTAAIWLLGMAPAFAADEAALAARLRAQVPAELADYFDTILYVSKAAEGPWAQRMFVFRRQPRGHFALSDDFPVSTGRERRERYFTTTPAGLFELDPDRLYRMTYSSKWDGAAMPYSMFLDYAYRTVKSGIALHAAAGAQNLASLGRRASGGCIRLPPEKAQRLFEEIRGGARGLVPVLAFDHEAGTTNRRGVMERDAMGRPRLKPGIKVLLVVDDFAGPAPLAAAGEDIVPSVGLRTSLVPDLP